MGSKLSKAFYQRPTETVAQELLGKTLTHFVGGEKISGIIVETEAYLGLNDPACHSFHGQRTQRVEPMYLLGGHSYVYLIYGMHNCFNVVTGGTKTPEAVLIRALEPLEGKTLMLKNRALASLNKSSERALTNGPGKLCQALQIDRSHNSLPLWGEDIYISSTNSNLLGELSLEVTQAPRIGIDYAGDAAEWPLRFFLNDSRFISKR